MIRILDFNAFAAGTVIDDEYEGVTVSAIGGAGKAMIFDSANPTGDDDDLASDTLKGLLIISEDGDSTDPDDNDGGGKLIFDFDNVVTMKSITFKDIEESAGKGTQIIFYDANDNEIDAQFVQPTQDGGETTVQLFVPGTSKVKVVLEGSGAIDNVKFDDPGASKGDGIVSNGDEDALIDVAYVGDPEGDMIDNSDALLPGEAPQDDIVDAQGGDDTIYAGQGDDEVFAGAGDDVVEGGVGNDAIYGDSELYANASDAGNDDLSGGEGDDTLVGEGGDDTLIGGEGTDKLIGGDDADTFVGATGGDWIDGGDGGDDYDTLDLRDSGPLRVVNETVDDDGNSTSGTVEFLDDDGAVVDAAYFAEIENLLVSEVNSAPDAVDDSTDGVEDESILVDLLANDSDPDGDPLTVVAATVPAEQGTLVDNGDGTVSFTPADDFNGPATISYTIEDPAGLQDSAIQTVNLAPVNDAPVAEDDSDSTPEDTAVTVDLLANDFDVDGDDLTVISATVPADEGTLIDNGDGTVTFTPAEDFTGEATISYSIEDAEGLTDSAVHTITVSVVAEAPTAVDDTADTDEDTPITIDVLANDTDPQDDPLTITEASVPEEQGTVEIVGNELLFTPADDFTGPATITYTVEDPDGNADEGEAVVEVNPVNDAPVAEDDADSTDFNTPVTVDLLANDSDVDGDDLSVVDATVPGDQGALVNNGDGTVTFTPVDDFEGVATISYTIEDEEGLADSAVHTITVGDDPRDGFVDGTDGDDLIDTDYTGDPDGDVIDGDDAILPGTEGDEDVVRAGDGDDTVAAGEGSDTVDGGGGDDVIDTGNGDLAPDLAYPFADTDPLGYPADTDPEDDRDSVDGGDGNDTITTGDDRDTIDGGSGADVINAGIDDDVINGDDGDDRVVGGEGNDLIQGGEGDDTIYAGNDPDLGLDILDIPDEPTDGFPFSPDRNPDNGQDTVFGGAGDDVIYGADDDDVLDGGTGDDLLDGQIDDDTLTGGSGEDTLQGGQGDDSLSGGTDNDTVDGGIGDDTVRGNRGDDLVLGGAGDDVLDGGGENDTLEGGAGDDGLQGGQGDDLLDGGDGNDTMTGGAGQDTFVNVNAGDDVDGGSGPIDIDTLDLRGSAPEGGSFSITYTSADNEDGIVDYLDADGNDAGTLVFEEIENIIPCFTPGTKIATPKGERLVEELQVGDRVITRDNGIQEIRWVGARDMSGAELEMASHLKPVLIRQGALGNDLPERDMMVSPNHRVLVANDKTALYFEEREVLVAAKHLTTKEGIDIVDVSHTTYIHIMFDQHEVILSDGTWTESFQPGDQTLAGIGNAQRDEILELFPELATKEGVEAYAAARRSLKKHEAKLILK